MSSINYVADLNDLIHEAYAAQEAFDKWDDGFTYGEWGRREVQLDVVVQELDEANLTLVMYIAENHAAIIEQIAAQAKEQDHGE